MDTVPHPPFSTILFSVVGVDTEGAVGQGVVTQGVVDQSVVGQGVVDQSVVAQGVIVQSVVGQGVVGSGGIVQGVVDQGVVDQSVVIQDVVAQGVVDKSVVGQGFVGQSVIGLGIVEIVVDQSVVIQGVNVWYVYAGGVVFGEVVDHRQQLLSKRFQSRHQRWAVEKNTCKDNISVACMPFQPKKCPMTLRPFSVPFSRLFLQNLTAKLDRLMTLKHKTFKLLTLAIFLNCPDLATIFWFLCATSPQI